MRVINECVAILESGSHKERRRAVTTLTEIGEEAVRPLLRLCDYMQDMDIGDGELYLYDALFYIGEKTIEPFIDILKDPTDPLRRYAAEVIGMVKTERCIDVLLEVLAGSDDVIKPDIIKALGRTGDSRVFDVLLPYLYHEDEQTKIQALWALGELSDKHAVSHIYKFLEDEGERESKLVLDVARIVLEHYLKG